MSVNTAKTPAVIDCHEEKFKMETARNNSLKVQSFKLPEKACRNTVLIAISSVEKDKKIAGTTTNGNKKIKFLTTYLIACTVYFIVFLLFGIITQFFSYVKRFALK